VQVKTDERVTAQAAGREDRLEQPAPQAGPPRREERITREDIRIEHDDRYRLRPEAQFRADGGYREDVRIKDESRFSGPGRFQDTVQVQDRRDSRVEIEVERQRYREPFRRYTDAQIDVQDRVYDRSSRQQPTPKVDLDSRIDIIEREYRERTSPIVSESHTTRVTQRQPAAPEVSTFRQQYASGGFADEAVKFDDVQVNVSDKVIAETRAPRSSTPRRDMGYYDDDGHYHSLRHGLRRAADHLIHPFESHHHNTERVVEREEDITIQEKEIVEMSAPRGYRALPPNTITIPCHHIRIGDLLILQGRPCQVIRITTSAQTGQHRYLGVDLFTKQLQEESSFVSSPSPSVVVQNMIGPVFKQYRVLDIREDGLVVAITETGDVKQGLAVLDQSGLLNRVSEAFNNGRGSVRVLVISDEGRELVVDYKIVHGSRL